METWLILLKFKIACEYFALKGFDPQSQSRLMISQKWRNSLTAVINATQTVEGMQTRHARTTMCDQDRSHTQGAKSHYLGIASIAS